MIPTKKDKKGLGIDILSVLFHLTSPQSALNMSSKVVVVVLVCLAATTVQAVSIGSLLQRDYKVYVTMPITRDRAVSQGWVPMVNSTYCELGLGIPYVPSSDAPNEGAPLWLYLTPGGQASGAAVLYYDHIEKQPKNLIDQGFILPVSSGVYYVGVGFRSWDAACSYANSSYPLGGVSTYAPCRLMTAS